VKRQNGLAANSIAGQLARPEGLACCRGCA
jgi:hypothetical protein